MARPAPTRAASTTRGSRSWRSTASCGAAQAAGQVDATASRSSRVTTTAPGRQGERAHPDAGQQRRDERRPPRRRAPARAGGACAAPPAPVRGGCRARRRRHEGRRQPFRASATDSAKSATRGPQREAMSSSAASTWPFLTAGTVSNAGTLGERLGGLVAALGVGQHDQVRRLADDVLGGQLRVAAGGVGGAVGDVLQAEHRVDAADERAARRRSRRSGRARGRPSCPSASAGTDATAALIRSCMSATTSSASSAWPVASPRVVELRVGVVEGLRRHRAAGWAPSGRRARRRCRSGRR